MSRHSASMGPEYFEQLYETDPDPWNFAGSTYEANKYAASIDALPDRRFGAAFEVGCSIGILTRQLATRCDRLLAVDVAETALAQARLNCTSPNVTFENRRIPHDWPTLRFDLITFSEVLYYLDADDLQTTALQTRKSLALGGTVLLVHYTGETNYPLTGDQATTIFETALQLPASYRSCAERYRLDLYSLI